MHELQTVTPIVSFEASALAFRRFFEELSQAFFERETALLQIQLALLCREHVLITGPPGTAKSAVAHSVLGRIVDQNTGEPSLFSKQLSETTVQADLIGPVNFKVLTETGRTEYLTDEGMLGAIHAFLDEVFDGRDMLLRSILNVLHERELKHGRTVTAGRLECAIMTSNRYLSEAVSRSPELLLAFADRLSFICFVPKAFARPSSRGAMLQRATTGQLPHLKRVLTIQHLDVLQAAVEKVRIGSEVLEGIERLADNLERALTEQVAKLPDYVPTKTFSQRSLVKGLWALKAWVVRHAIFDQPGRKLEAAPEDLEALRHFFLLGGPPPNEVEALLTGAVDPRERAQLEILRLEHRAFDQALEKTHGDLPKAAARETESLKVDEDRAAAEALEKSFGAEAAHELAEALRHKLIPGPRHTSNRVHLLEVARSFVRTIHARIQKVVSGQGESRGGLAQILLFREALRLAREIPELSADAASLDERLGDYCAQALEMAVLGAESSEFDESMDLDQLAGLAENVEEELSGLRALALELTPHDRVAALLTQERDARARIAQALRHKAPEAYHRRAPGPVESLEAEGHKVAQLERSLELLAPGTGALRGQLLGPHAVDYVRSRITQLSFDRLDQLTRLLQEVSRQLEREGVKPGPVLDECRVFLDERLNRYVEELKARVPHPKVVPQRVLTGGAYMDYRQAFTGISHEGDRASLATLRSLLPADAETEAVERGIDDEMAQVELSLLESRARYLALWLSQVVATLGPLDGLRTTAAAENAFASLVKSRFPLLAVKEGELLRLQTALEGLASREGEVGDAARAVRHSVARMTEDFGGFSKKLLEMRVGR